jgi:hypothetical protein
MSRDDQPRNRTEPPGRPPGSPKTDGRKASAAPWARLSGAGLELAFITIALGAIGAVIDQQLQSPRPVCSALGGLLGFGLGMIRFIRLATSISKTQRTMESTRSFDAPDESGKDEDHDSRAI